MPHAKHRDCAHMNKNALKRDILSLLREDHLKLNQIIEQTELSKEDVWTALEALEIDNQVRCNAGFWQLTTNN